MSWKRLDKRERGMALTTLVLVLMLASLLGPMVSDTTEANSLGSPDRNIEAENCFCHTNTASGKEPSDAIVVFIDPGSVDKMVTNGNATITVTIKYTNANNDTTYGYAIDLDSEDGRNLDGAGLKANSGTPSENKTHLAQSEPQETNVFNITLTAPKKPQRVRFTFVGMATNNDGTERADHWNTAAKVIEVFKMREVSINASIKNNGEVEAKDVNLTFSVDGEMIGMEYIPVIPPDEVFNITYRWDATFYSPGQYKIEVLIDSNQSNLELNEGNNRIVKTIMLEPIGEGDKEGYDLMTISYMVIGAIVILLIIGVLYRRFA